MLQKTKEMVVDFGRKQELKPPQVPPHKGRLMNSSLQQRGDKSRSETVSPLMPGQVQGLLLGANGAKEPADMELPGWL